jgi:hypothetical protein
LLLRHAWPTTLDFAETLDSADIVLPLITLRYAAFAAYRSWFTAFSHYRSAKPRRAFATSLYGASFEHTPDFRIQGLLIFTDTDYVTSINNK